MGKKDKNKKKGSVFGYLFILIGLAVVAIGVILALGAVDQVTETAASVPVLKDYLDDSTVMYGIAGGGGVLFLIGMVMKPKKDKKK